MDGNNSIVIFVFQFSVVVKGIERKLSNLGYHVEIVDKILDMPAKAVGTEMFILYLPGEIMDDVSKQKGVTQICEIVSKNKRKMLLLGEKKFHLDLLRIIPKLEDYEWLDRPVSEEVLEDAVKRTMDSEGPVSVKKRILIVDDDPSYAAMVREWIRTDYHADIVTAGMKAITFLLANPVDLILLDYEMPVVDGPQVLQMLKQEEATAHIPVIFLTGNGTKEAVSRVMELKPDGYILKSATRDDILKYLKNKLS